MFEYLLKFPLWTYLKIKSFDLFLPSSLKFFSIFPKWGPPPWIRAWRTAIPLLEIGRDNNVRAQLWKDEGASLEYDSAGILRINWHVFFICLNYSVEFSNFPLQKNAFTMSLALEVMECNKIYYYFKFQFVKTWPTNEPSLKPDTDH